MSMFAPPPENLTKIRRKIVIGGFRFALFLFLAAFAESFATLERSLLSQTMALVAIR